MNNFFTHPMRLFFITAAVCGMVGGLSFLVSDNYILLHQMIFLNIVPACAYGGFLLTALPDWANYSGSLKKISTTLYSLIILAFLALPFNYLITGSFIALFWLVLLGFCAVLLWQDKNDNNFSILLILSLLFILQIAFLYKNDFQFLYAQIHISVAAISVVSFRVSMVLGDEALKKTNYKDPVFLPNFVYKNLLAFFAILYALSLLFLDEKTSGFIALGVGCVMLAKLKELHYFALLKRHYIIFYYTLQLACAAGYLWLGTTQILSIPHTSPLHLITLSYYFSMILFIFTTAGLRHSGFIELKFPLLGILAIITMVVCGIVRSLFSHWSGYIHLSASLLILAFALYAYPFFKIFTQKPFTDDPE